jgi:hypothetical protein
MYRRSAADLSIIPLIPRLAFAVGYRSPPLRGYDSSYNDTLFRIASRLRSWNIDACKFHLL